LIDYYIIIFICPAGARNAM